MWNLKNPTSVNVTKRSRLIAVENKLRVTTGEGVGGAMYKSRGVRGANYWV